MSLPPILVLDLDGTLVDTVEDLVATLNAVLAKLGHAELSAERARTMVGHGAKQMLRQGLVAAGEEPDAARLDAIFPRFLEHYSRHVADRSRPYPGVVEALDRFLARGWRLAVCTNKLEGLSRLLLGRLDLAARFHAICGPDVNGAAKPDPAHLLKSIERAGGAPERALLVGDSEIDIRTAQAADIPVVAVDFGYSQADVRTFGPDAVISHFDELEAAVEALPLGWTAGNLTPATR